MAQFDFVVPVEFLKQLGRLADVEKYAPQMLEESAPILLKTTKAALSSVISGDSTGEMVASVKISHVFHNGYGFYLTVRPTGKDKNGVRNMEKAAYLEYGTSKRSARPWAARAQNDAEPAVLAKMTEVFERECSKE